MFEPKMASTIVGEKSKFLEGLKMNKKLKT
jgi:hypothetical protein